MGSGTRGSARFERELEDMGLDEFTIAEGLALWDEAEIAVMCGSDLPFERVAAGEYARETGLVYGSGHLGGIKAVPCIHGKFTGEDCPDCEGIR
jgi:hypothetical protein